MAEGVLTPEELERLRQKVQPQLATGADIAPLRMADVKYGTTAPAQLGQAPAAGAFEKLATESGQMLAGTPEGQAEVERVDRQARRERRQRRRRQREERELSRWQQNVESLFGKIITSEDAGDALGTHTDDPNLVPFAELPREVRDYVAAGYTGGAQPLYFDRSRLTEDEQVVLAKMVAAGRQEKALRMAAAEQERADRFQELGDRNG